MSKGKKQLAGSNVRTSATASAKNIPAQPQGLGSMISWLVILLAILPIIYSNVTMDPDISIRYMCLAIFVFLFVLYFYFFRKTTIPSSLPVLVKVVLALGILFSIWNMVATYASINKAASYYEIARSWLNVFLLAIVMVAVSREEGKVVRICNTILVVSFIHSFIGIFQYYELAFTELPGDLAFPYGLMANRNLFGSAQALAIPFVLFSLYKASKPWKYAAIIALFFLIMSVIISQTRASWVSTAGIGLVSFIFVALFSRKDLKRWAIGTGIAVAATVLIVVFLFATEKDNSFSTSIKERALSLAAAAPEKSGVAVNASERVKMWNKTIDLINNRPVLGAGPANWKVLIPAYGTEGLYWATGKWVPDRPHNEYLKIAAETGIPGAVFYFGMWLLLGFIAFRLIIGSATADRKILAILMMAGLAGFAADCMFSFPTERIEHSLYTTLMGGIILGIYINQQNKARATGNLNRGVVVAVLLITAFNIFMAYKKYDFEKHMNMAKQYENSAMHMDAINAAEAGKNSFVTLDPNGYPLELRTGNGYHKLKNYEEALAEMNKAIKYNPYSVTIYNNMGTIYTDMKLSLKAIECYEKAVRISPGFEIALKNLAVNYFEARNYAGVIKTLEKLNVSDDAYLTSILTQSKQMVQSGQ